MEGSIEVESVGAGIGAVAGGAGVATANAGRGGGRDAPAAFFSPSWSVFLIVDGSFPGCSNREEVVLAEEGSSCLTVAGDSFWVAAAKEGPASLGVTGGNVELPSMLVGERFLIASSHSAFNLSIFSCKLLSSFIAISASFKEGI